jgi:alkylated DNA repair dioxygenase AlkB
MEILSRKVRIPKLFENSESANTSVNLAGLRYQSELISAELETELITRIKDLPFREFEFHGYLGKRRIVSYGWRYDYSGRGTLRPADEIPPLLLDVRQMAARFGNLDAESLSQALVTEYRAGAGIGWHRDKAVFGNVIGISLLAPCVLRFRRKLKAGPKGNRVRTDWERVNLPAERRSAYLLSGAVRHEWEHSILAVDELRYSITFRTLRIS